MYAGQTLLFCQIHHFSQACVHLLTIHSDHSLTFVRIKIYNNFVVSIRNAYLTCGQIEPIIGILTYIYLIKKKKHHEFFFFSPVPAYTTYSDRQYRYRINIYTYILYTTIHTHTHTHCFCLVATGIIIYIYITIYIYIYVCMQKRYFHKKKNSFILYIMQVYERYSSDKRSYNTIMRVYYFSGRSINIYEVC